MKTLFQVLVFIFVVSVSIQTSAQQSGAKVGNKPTTVVTEVAPTAGAFVAPAGSGNSGSPAKYPGIEGEAFIGSDWPAGIIVLSNGGTIDNYFLRYNILEDQMQFISGKDTLAFASPQELNTISFGNHTFIYETFQCENTIRKGYFELIEPGKNKLLLKRVITTEINIESSNANSQEKKYFVDNCYFISKPGQPASKLMCNRKSALAVLNEHSNEIEEYLRVTGNKVKTPDDLKKLVAYYNSLDE
jgi:hypothetical protein